MILQALNSYYRRLAEIGDPAVAPEGFAPQGIHFALCLNEDGELLDIVDLRESDAKSKKLLPKRMIVPGLDKKRSVDITPNYLWDGAGYVLGRDDKGKPERTAKCRTAFQQLHAKLLQDVDCQEARALLHFLQIDYARHPKVEALWEDLASANLVFRLGRQYLHDVDALRDIWSNRGQGEKSAESICLVSGEQTPIAVLHMPIKGVVGAQSAGASLCSYNITAAESFGKKQNLNAPVSKSAAFGYTTALNYLIKHPDQSLRLGAATVVCWADKPSPLENKIFAFLSGSQPRVGQEADTQAAMERAGVLRRLGRGAAIAEAWPELDPGVDMHVLAIAPNAARLSVSFYLHGTAKDFLEHIIAYYRNLAVVKQYDDEPEFPSTWQVAAAVLGPHKKMAEVERLAADVLKAALSCRPYPAYLLPMCLQRLRSGDKLNSIRAGLIKAMLIRNYNLNSQEEAPMSLNPDHPSPAYQLGRLFALLVGVQHKAIGTNINADIRDKYYGSASATPAMVFPILLRNAQNHISKAKAYGYDKLIRDLLEHIDDEFPAHLDLKDQGLFALGYYHQRAEKSVKQDEETQTEPKQA